MFHARETSVQEEVRGVSMKKGCYRHAKFELGNAAYESISRWCRVDVGEVALEVRTAWKDRMRLPGPFISSNDLDEASSEHVDEEHAALSQIPGSDARRTGHGKTSFHPDLRLTLPPTMSQVNTNTPVKDLTRKDALAVNIKSILDHLITALGFARADVPLPLASVKPHDDVHQSTEKTMESTQVSLEKLQAKVHSLEKDLETYQSYASPASAGIKQAIAELRSSNEMLENVVRAIMDRRAHEVKVAERRAVCKLLIILVLGMLCGVWIHDSNFRPRSAGFKVMAYLDRMM
ncbi:hypothetical protein OF83DRAFT_1087547 [Amylostereum chailletii]|nr:hypothetical protein OF83DRAFT_1087547 [Amylostereum chailletii]